MTEAGIKGAHREPNRVSLDSGSALWDGVLSSPVRTPTKAVNPHGVMRMWIGASIMRQVHPDLVRAFEIGDTQKAASKGKGKARAKEIDDSSEVEVLSSPAPVNTGQSRQASIASLPASSSSQSRVDGSRPGSSRSSRFLFSFSNPDDPDIIEIDDDEDGEQPLQAPIPLPLAEPTTRHPVSRRPHDFLRDDEDDDEGPRDKFDDILDQILGHSKAKQAAKRKGQTSRPAKAMAGSSRASARSSNPPQPSAKRRKVAQPLDNPGPSSSSDPRSKMDQPRPLKPLPPTVLPPQPQGTARPPRVESRHSHPAMPAFSRSPSPIITSKSSAFPSASFSGHVVPDLHKTNTRPVTTIARSAVSPSLEGKAPRNGQGRARLPVIEQMKHVVLHSSDDDDDLVDLDSDSDDDLLASAVLLKKISDVNRRETERRNQRQDSASLIPSSSQTSGLLSDDADVIDLT